MSNDFPPVPSGMELQGIVYSVSCGGLSASVAAFSVSIGIEDPYLYTIEVAFSTYGSFGDFSQSAFEADLLATLNSMCQTQADQTGQTLAEVQETADITINRQWVWQNTEGATLSWNDAGLTYPG